MDQRLAPCDPRGRGQTPFVSFFAGVCPRKMTQEKVPRLGRPRSQRIGENIGSRNGSTPGPLRSQGEGANPIRVIFRGRLPAKNDTRKSSPPGPPAIPADRGETLGRGMDQRLGPCDPRGRGQTPFVSFFAGVCPRKMTQEKVPRPWGRGLGVGELYTVTTKPVA